MEWVARVSDLWAAFDDLEAEIFLKRMQALVDERTARRHPRNQSG